ncbi:site-specific DNA-methyltransferase [Spirochaetota bacterium]|nr:site-specific DNA-methyltransferase [Spirochaetota bacterium]
MKTLDRRLLKTPDLNAERLERLKKLFPDLFTLEGKLDPNEFKKVIDLDLVPESERFEFRWFGKSGAKRQAFTPTQATLCYDKSRSVNPDTATGNIIIEGENLEALKCLLAAYRGKIKCIYIDPPYNTGKDFIYSDNYTEGQQSYLEQIEATKNGIKLDTNVEDGGRFHSNWLNMIYPRLLLARELLTDDGVIFISIDDHEVHRLRNICDEVFHEPNFIAQLVWTTKKGAQGMETGRHIVPNHEYLLVYAKSTEFKFLGIERSQAGFSNPDNDKRGLWKRQQMQRLGQGFPKRTLIDPKTGKKYTFETPYTQTKLTKWLNEGSVLFPQNNTKYPIRKEFLAEYKNKKQLVSMLGLYPTKASTQELYGLFADQKIFPNPKPVALLKQLFEVATEKNDIVLDFFAGSGTTAEAVLTCNHEDNHNRRFILIQIPERITQKTSRAAYRAGFNKISEITIERCKRAICQLHKKAAQMCSATPAKYHAVRANDNSTLVKGNSMTTGDKESLKKIGFKVYRLAKSNFMRVEFALDYTQPEKVLIETLNRYIKEKETQFFNKADEAAMLDEILLKNGFMLDYIRTQCKIISQNKVYEVKDQFKDCLICVDDSIKPKTLEELNSLKDRIFICLERALDSTMKFNLDRLFKKKLLIV